MIQNMKKIKTVFVGMILGAMFFIVPLSAKAAIITCGTGREMCTLCDIISGMKTIIDYLMKLSVGVALLAVTIGGVMYIVSAGDSGLIDQAKSTMKNAAIGFVIIFAGWLIINTTITYIGSKKDATTGKATFGMNITSWGEFDCTAADRGGN